MIEIIPAIDIIDGKCVRLTKGDYSTKKVYNTDPLDTAMMFEDCGLRRLHLVDLDGAHKGHIVNYRILEKLASRTSLVIDFGGGIKDDIDVNIAFNSGAAMITGGSVVVRNPDMFSRWLMQYGSERIILGADVKDGRIAVNGWNETSSDLLIPFVKEWVEKGISKLISTDVGCDGMLQGPNKDMYVQLREEFPDTYIIASGGVSSMSDVEALEEAGVPAVIVGKAIYEGKIRLEEISS
jgi:phosphoribosylformimino-5-aminoimidazole carboxamide ribotide isomerase